jgi:hypothetical protein
MAQIKILCPTKQTGYWAYSGKSGFTTIYKLNKHPETDVLLNAQHPV